MQRLYSIVALRLIFRELYDELYDRFREELRAVVPRFLDEWVGNVIYLVFSEASYDYVVEFVKKVKDKYGIIDARGADVFVYGFMKPGSRII